MGVRLNGVPPVLSGGNLQSVYVLEQLHFHWGAEHTVDGSRDPLELHLVHYNNQYANFSVAAQHENGIAVVSVLFKVEIIFITLYIIVSFSLTSIIFSKYNVVILYYS